MKPLALEEEALLEAIFAAPDDDTPRLVYADFLLQRGSDMDAHHGELIVVQCERARLEREEKTTTPEYRRLCWRERSLRARESRDYETAGEYHRGFIHRWTGESPSPASLRAVAKERFAPLLETLVLRAGASRVELDARAAFAVVNDLPDDEPLWLPEHGLPHPLLVPAVAGVRYGSPTERTIRDLIDLPAPNLRAVTCTGGLRFTGGAMDEYASTPSFRRLDHLALWELDDGEAGRFIEMAPPRARHLTVVSDRSDDLVFMERAFRGCPALEHVRELNVSVPYRAAHIELLAGATALEDWRAPVGMAPEALALVATSALTKRVRHLEVTFQGYPSVIELVTAPWERLTSLAIGNATIGMELVHASALDTLVTLRLFGCRISGDVEAALRARWPHVRIE